MKWTISNYKTWGHLEKTFDWVADMRGIPQDTVHHAEGDVAIHTNMVLEALRFLPEYNQLGELQQELLFAAALLHDVEKRSTTVEDATGRITSAGHARKGEFTTRQILYADIPTPFKLREEIAALVRHHGLPLWVMEKFNPTKVLLDASLRIDMKLLAMLAKADVLGRICADQRGMLERISFFEAFCEEQQCWHAPKVFSSDLARFTYFQKENGFPDYEPFDDLRGEVIMMSGLPGMGKDTFLKKNYPDLPVVSLDDIRRKHKLKPDDTSATGWAVQEAKEQAKVFLRKGQPFAWNATNITRQTRSQWIDLFASYKARVKVIYIEVPYKDWVRQNNDREHPVPQAVLSRLLSKLEVPMLSEAHEVTYVA
ncbi:MAG: AAA family ATPase [Bacteroidota bacterium]